MQYSCQQNFALMVSDGYWNSRNETSTYGPLKLNNTVQVYDLDGSGTGTVAPMLDPIPAPNTLADVAKYYYETDLRHPVIPLNDSTCQSGSTGANLCPCNDGSTGASMPPPAQACPFNHYVPNVPTRGLDNYRTPHMTTFTLGIGIKGAGPPAWPDPLTSTVSPYYDASARNQVRTRVDDLWHAAINGRGSYYNAVDTTTLASSLIKALGDVTGHLGYGAAGATSRLAPVSGDNAIYVASFQTGDSGTESDNVTPKPSWTGNLVADSINVDTGAVNLVPTWCVESVGSCTGTLGAKAASGRTIKFNLNGALGDFTIANLTTAGFGAYFDNSKLSQYSSFSAADLLNATGANLVEYLRGKTTYMTTNVTTPKLYRNRRATLGDVIDTQPVFQGKPYFAYADSGYDAFKTAQQSRAGAIFVGANDGMVHAFNPSNGDELWAFAPSPVIPNMYRLADANYAAIHRNFVDGRLVYSDVCVAADCTNATAADWRTILVGGLGSGGRGFFALDVTNPASPTLLWEFTAPNADTDNLVSPPLSKDADLGYSYGNPLAVKTSDGKRWVVVLSSGYDNVKRGIAGDPYDADGSGGGFLFVLDPINGYRRGTSPKIPTNVGSKTTPSGLSRIAYWADNPEKDATAVYAYGGDLLGNLWRIDINTADVVKLATFTGKLSDGTGTLQPQPITTRPELTRVNGKRRVFVATGKFLEPSDLDAPLRPRHASRSSRCIRWSTTVPSQIRAATSSIKH